MDLCMTGGLGFLGSRIRFRLWGLGFRKWSLGFWGTNLELRA